MHSKKILLGCLLLSLFLSQSVAITHAQIPTVTNQNAAKSELLAKLITQLQYLQEQLENLRKYQPGKPLNTITEIIGPRKVSTGEYTTWEFVTKNNDPANASMMIDWGDGMTSVSGSGHTYHTPGTYTITATNHDGNGEPYTMSLEVTVAANKNAGALTAWGNKLVTNKSLIPENKFRAYLFNTKNFKSIANSTIVDQPLLIYPNHSLTGSYGQMDEGTLGAYWVGSFSYSKDTTVYFDFSDPQWDSARFIVDGKTIIETKRNKSFETPHINLKKGKHTIEVEYQVNWHAGFFRAKIGTVNPSYTDIAVAQAAAKAIAGTNAVKVKSHEYSPSDVLTGMSTISIPNTTTSKILDLSSYEPTVWDVSGADTKGVKAIILSSYSGAADVKNAGTIPIFRTRNYSD